MRRKAADIRMQPVPDRFGSLKRDQLLDDDAKQAWQAVVDEPERRQAMPFDNRSEARLAGNELIDGDLEIVGRDDARSQTLSP
jgi:hypothetical protein